MEREVYFEASYKQINIIKKRSYRYNNTQDAESTVVKVFSYEGHITDCFLCGTGHQSYKILKDQRSSHPVRCSSLLII